MKPRTISEFLYSIHASVHRGRRRKELPRIIVPVLQIHNSFFTLFNLKDCSRL